MDRLKNVAKTTRQRMSNRPQNQNPESSASLSVPHANLPAADSASVTAVNEGVMGPFPGTAVHDYAVSEPQPQEPPTSLQSSVDAEKPLPDTPAATHVTPGRVGAPSSSRTADSSSRLTVPTTVPPRRSSITRPGEPRQTQQPRRPSVSIRNPSIGIRREPSAQNLRGASAQTAGTLPNGSSLGLAPTAPRLPTLAEETHDGRAPSVSSVSSVSTAPDAFGEKPTGWRKARLSVASKLGLRKERTSENTEPLPPALGAEYDSNMVDVLDTLDPEVQTLTSLTNVQNSLFIPNLGRFVNRRPTYVLRSRPSRMSSYDDLDEVVANQMAREEARQEEERPQGRPAPQLERMQTMETLRTIDSRMSDSRFAVLPHGTSLDGWSKEDKKELNDHVRHMLHSRRSKFKRSMRGFGQYVRRPLGFLVTLYATLITLFGLAWVLFLIGWINVGGRQLYIINIIDNILVALFALVGDGLAPFRAVDTYHMIYIAHYHHYTWSRRKKEMLPELHDHNDLPSTNAPFGESRPPVDDDKAEGQYQYEYTILTPKQQKNLEHHQAKFTKSHSFYKPHETETHHAFPLRLLVAIVVLLDCHSLFQIALGTCTWSIYYKRRPFALTTVILICSITCNATAGLLILIGDRRTRKKDVLERMNRQELTEEAIEHLEKKWEKEEEKARESESDLEASASGSSQPKQGRRSLTLNRDKPWKEG